MSHESNFCDQRGGVRTGGCSAPSKSESREGKSHQYPTRVACIKALVERMDKYPSSRDKEYNESVNYTGDYNSWLMATGYMYTATTNKNWAANGMRESYYEQDRTIRWTTNEGLIIVGGKGQHQTLRSATNMACYNIFKNVRNMLPRFQMDELDSSTESNQEILTYSEEVSVKWYWIEFLNSQWRRGYHKRLPRVQVDEQTEQGIIKQESDKQSNTIITQDQAESASKHTKALDRVSDIASSEPLHRFGTITNRWMPLDSFTIATSYVQGHMLKSYYFPEAIYASGCAPNLIPFETFIYGRMDVEIRIVVNANKFCCGKLIMSSKYDTYQADLVQKGYQSALSRNHVIIDLCANNEGVIQIPFRYHRPYVRLVKNDLNTIGVRPSKYASLYLHMLSALQTGKGGPSEIGVRLFFRLKQAAFTGMSYRVKVQMDSVERIVSDTANMALRSTLREAEKVFDQMGRSRNQDKPGNIKAMTVVPQPRLNFSGGVGVVDVVPLRINPHALTNYSHIEIPDDEPRSFYDLARIWGVIKSFTWSSTATEGSIICDMVIDPTCRSYGDDGRDAEFTPLEYACGNYAFWTGPIELRIDFVSNAFHTGTVQLSAEFGRTSSSSNTCESSSAYTKIFHLGDQKSVTFTVPYIYDTVMRRTCANYMNPYNHVNASNDIAKRAVTVAPLSQTHFKVRVLNLLRPVSTASQEIDCLVFIRAGKNFYMHGLKGHSYGPCNSILTMDEFPFEYPIVEPTPTVAGTNADTQVPAKAAATGRRRRSVGEAELKQYAHKYLPENVRNEWNEYRADVLPRIQMDNGEKEDLDETQDFSEGVSARAILTTENQMNFKDLLRRPTLIMSGVKVDTQQGKNIGFFIPLQPPSRQMTMTYSEKTKEYGINGDWAPTLGFTSASSIMDMFRCWRGSMRYTIVAYGAKEPFYVSLIPHSGTRLLSNHQISSEGSIDYNLTGFNFTTAIVVPSINPTVTIEAPYESENTWTLTFDEDALRNYSWRDKGDYNSGHLMITSREKIMIDVWWSAGDDFEFSNFYGVPYTRFNGQLYRLSDKHARIQMDTDFLLNEGATKVSSFCSKYVKPGVVARAAVGMIPVVGTPILVAETLTNVNDKCDIAIGRINHMVDEGADTLNKIKNLAERSSSSIDTISSLIAETVNSVGSTLKGLIHGVDILYNLLLDIIVAWMEKSWRVIGIAIVRFVGKFVLQSFGVMDKLMTYAEQISNYISEMVSRDTPSVQVETNDHVFVGILAGLVGTIVGVQINPLDWAGSWTRNIGLRLTSATGIAYLVHVMNFVRQTFTTIREMFMRALGYVSPEARALKRLSESSEMIERFVREAQIVTSESNMALINQPAFRRRFWFSVLQAHQIQRMLCSIPANVVSYQLSKLCSDLIKLGNEKFMDLSASPVRFEPMVICLEGEPGVGKSYATEALVDELLQSVGIQTRATEKIYYRTAGERFWSGYRDQPVVVYDEWLNTTDPVRNTDQIAEFMKLKSTGIFVPEMAHLEEKKIRGNPLIIILCCNSAFPNSLSDYATYPRAILRRRDAVLRVERTSEYEGVNPVDCNSDQKEGFKKYDHLQFAKYNDVTDMKTLTTSRLGYEEMKRWLTNAWKKYYVHQIEQVKIRMQRLPDYMQNVEGNYALADPFTIFYQLNNQIDLDQSVNVNGFTHYEALETAVTLTMSALQNPPQENTIEVEDIPWEAARTQDDGMAILSGAVAGIGWFGAIPAWIARVSKRQLRKWNEQINPLRTDIRSCPVCIDDHVACAFVCAQTKNNESGAQHTICYTCYESLIRFGDGRCPVCRCEQMEFLIGREDIQNLSVWYRMAHTGLCTVEWLCDRLIEYYGWRRTHLGYTIAADFLMSTFSQAVMGAFGAGLQASNTVQWYVYWISMAVSTFNALGRSIVVSETQTDWDEYSMPVAQMQPRERDSFEIEITPNIIEDLILKTRHSPMCLHHKVKQHIGSVKLEGEVWRVLDEVDRRVLDVSIYACETNCHLLQQEEPVEYYRTIIQNWLALNRRTIRSLYVDYYNNPVRETYERVPVLFRAHWMIVGVEPLSESWWVYLGEVWHNYKNFLIYSAAAVSVIAALLGTYHFATRVNSISGAMQQISATAGSPERSPRNPRRVIQRDAGRRAYFHAEQSTPTMYEVAMGYVCRNTFALELKIGTKSKIMYGTGLFNHFLLIPKHYMRVIKRAIGDGHELYGWPLAQAQLRANIRLSSDNMRESDETDLAYMVLPPKFPIFKDIRKFLAMESDFDTPITSEGILIANPKSGCEFVREIEVDISGIQAEQVVLDSDNSTFTVKDVLVYNYSKPGVCGSLLLRENHQRPILSMHIAGIGEGISGYGYGILLTQEALKHLCENNVVPAQFDDVPYGSIEDAKFIFDEDVHLYYYGSVEPQKTPYVPTKSKLVKSLIHGADGLETIMEPAILDKNDPRYIHAESPLSAGVRKHGKITEDFKPDMVSEASNNLWDLWYSKMKPLVADPSVLSDEQAVVGLDINHYTAMDLSTSAGYPYSLNKQRTRKDQYIGVRRDDNLKAIGVETWDPELLKIMEEKREKRRKGIVPHTLFVDTLKDEKRPREKTRGLGGTRVFCNSPVDYVIECRKYFLHFIAAFMDQRMDLMHAVGINPTSIEWTWLTNELLKKNGKFCTIDYSNFGPGYNASVAKAAYEIIIRWTMENVKGEHGKELDERVLRCIVYECLQSMHICNNTVYQQGAGSPSGAVFTTTVNTIVNQLYLIIAWKELVPKILFQQDINTFKENVALFCFGDDAIFSVKEEFMEYYNMKTIMTFFANYRIVATDAQKSGQMKVCEQLSEAQFLKRGFIKHPKRDGTWLPPLKDESIKSCTQWVWRAENMKEATRVNANAALMEAYTHGVDYFEKFKVIVNRALRRAKIAPITGTWDDFDNMFMTEGFEFNIDTYLLLN